MINQQVKQDKSQSILEAFKKYGASAWKEIKDLWLSLDPQTQRMLLTAMFKINPEQAKLFAGEAGLTTSPDIPQTSPKTPNQIPILITIGLVLMVLIVAFMVIKK